MHSSRNFFKEVKAFRKFIVKTLELKDNTKLVMSKKYNKVRIHYFLEGATEDDIYKVNFMYLKGQISNDKSICNACVDTDNKIIYFPVGDRLKGNKYYLYSTLAHEYVHVWQNQKGLPLDEWIADALSVTLMKDFFNKNVRPIRDGIVYELCEACSIHAGNDNLPVCCVCDGKMLVPVEEE